MNVKNTFREVWNGESSSLFLMVVFLVFIYAIWLLLFILLLVISLAIIPRGPVYAILGPLLAILSFALWMGGCNYIDGKV